MKNALSISNLKLALDSFSLENISLECKAKEYRILLGPTGCGKTTLLRTILGIIKSESGRIVLNQNDISEDSIETRKIGYIPQHQFLFPHLSVEKNILFGASRFESSKRKKIAEELYSMLGISHLKQRSVIELSGGERQKVALARTLASKPLALLLDEPFSAIDEGGRRALWFDLKRIVTSLEIPVLHVTHNLDEAYTLGDAVTVMIAGRLVQSGRPNEILERPESETVASFLGYNNIFRCGVEVFQPKAVAKSECGMNFVLPCAVNNKIVTVCIRPQDIKIIREDIPIREELAANVFNGELTELYFLPDICIGRFKADGSKNRFDLEMKFPAAITGRYGLFAGKKIRVGIWTPNIIVWNVY